MTLAALQRAFAGHVYGRASGIAAALADDRGLAVYRHAYRVTLREALRDIYARTAKWLGDDMFDAAADAYVGATPSRSWTLADYGGDFPAHLAASLPDDPEAAELAWLEGALRRAFAAADIVPVDRGSLATVDWERAHLLFAPAVAARWIATDVPGIWHALDSDRPPERIMLDRAAGIIVWRAGLEPRFRSADVGEADAVAAAIRGASFATICSVAAAAGAGEPQVGGWLAQWLDDGMIRAIASPGTDPA